MENLYRKLKKRESIIILLIFILLIFISNLCSTARSIPSIFNDEFGYWDSAAWFAGYDWSDISSQIQYYSYGYGIILGAIFRLTSNAELAYHFAIYLNGLWIGLSFFVLYKIISKLYSKLNFLTKLTISMIATLYSSTFTQRNYTWPECFLYLLFCINFYLVILIHEKVTYVRGGILALLSIFMYTIHQRTLSILIANILIVFIAFFQQQFNKKILLLFISILVLCCIMHMFLKNNIILHVWGNSISSEVNNMGDQIGKLDALMSFEGVKRLFLTFLGRIYYIVVATFMIVLFSLQRLIKKILDCPHLNKRAFDLPSCFLILSMIGVLGISVLSMFTSDFTDISHIIYGRYTDNILAPFILIGIAELLENKKSWKRLLMYINILVILGLGVSLFWEIFKPQWESQINNSGISIFVSSNGIRVWPGIAYAIIGWITICILTNIKKIKNEVKCIVIGVCLVSLWALNGNNAYHEFEADNSSIQYSSIECAKTIREIKNNFSNKLQVYAVPSEIGYGKWAVFSGNGLQFLLYDTEVKYIDSYSNYETLKNQPCVVLSSLEIETPEGFTDVLTTNNYKLFVPSAMNETMS